ncbi:hypothetical protein BKA62DRAFT_687569 [Auriculariales sp. MPI-PUGE-AT-0066]|nr:hypothetical protein BKA62DRAFT_687569 [Auriculariales sp. MPI-PUGE-AT-0066]
MGREHDYEYAPLPTGPDAQYLYEQPVQRKKCRHLAAKLLLVLAAGSVASWAAYKHCTELRVIVQRYEHQAAVRVSAPVISLSEDALVDGYDRGKLIECFPGDDDDDDDDARRAGGRIRIPLPPITLDSDAVYFFDYPTTHKPRRDDEPKQPIPTPPKTTIPRWKTGGTFQLEVSDSVDKVTVLSSIAFEDVLFARVCTFERESGAKGVGVIVPEELPEVDKYNLVRFRVKVPAQDIGSFESNLWNYTQTGGDLSDALFQNLALVGVGGDLRFESVAAHIANISTIGGNITGSYAAHDRFTIATVGGTVDIDLDFKSTDPERPAQLALSSAGGPLNATVSLGTTSEDFAGVFRVVASTTAPLNLVLKEAPAGSSVSLLASTVGGAASVTLPAAYEGSFEARTFGLKNQAELLARDGLKDPAGRGRKRTISSHTIGIPFGHGVSGEVYWGDERPERPAGNVRFEAIAAPLTLTV